MAITPSDFSKIWASNADTPEYTFSDANYQKGWDFVGNLPPTRAMWNAMQKSTDEKMKYVFDNFGAPLTASTVAEMTMQNRIYVYTGSETGYTAGHWYYWNGSAWTDGGVYNAVAVVTDTTLTQAGVPADAKATGDAIALKPDVDPTLTVSGESADAKVTGERIGAVDDIVYYNTDFSPTWESGILDYTTGEVTANASYKHFFAEVGDLKRIHVKTKIASVAGICFYDSNDVYIAGYRNTTGGTLETIDKDYDVPNGATKIGVTCIITDLSSASIVTAIDSETNYLLENGYNLPLYKSVESIVPSQGIMKNDGTVYNPSENYSGRYITDSVTGGEVIYASGYSNNTTYPCVLFKKSDNSYERFASRTATSYSETRIIAPSNATNVYVSGNNLYPPKLMRYKKLPSDTADNVVGTGKYGVNVKPLLAKYENGSLYVKKRVSPTKSICVIMANVGGNSLFNFSSIRQVDEVSGAYMSESFDSNGTSINAGSTDWIGPYMVQAINNPDGDVPAGNDYFTGGNHRTTNTGTGGGVTAIQTAFSVLFDGVEPQINKTYSVNEIVVKWTNAVQGNNTSKADGTGRAILDETWTVKIDKDGFHCENDIKPKESVVIKKYYGLQALFSSSNVIYKGGAVRTPYAISGESNSGNKTCRSVSIYSDDFEITMEVLPVDLGLFQYVPYSFFSTNGTNKVYSYAIGENVNANANEHFYLEGEYRFW